MEVNTNKEWVVHKFNNFNKFTFWIHRIGDGDNTRSVVCPKKTYGKPCPICEQVEKLSRNYAENEDEIKALKAKQRELFNIVDARDEEQLIQVYDTSYFHGFGEMLDSRLRNFDDDDEDEDFKNFADIPGGRILKVRFNEGSFNGNKFFAPSSIDFMERKEELDESIIDSAVCLDSCLKVLSYEQIVKLLAGTEDIEEKDSSEEKPTPKRATKAAKAPEEDEDEEEEEEEPPKHKKLAKKPTPVEEEDEDEDDEDEEEEKPATKKKSLKKPEPEEDDEDEEEDEEEEPVKPSKKLKRKPVEDEEDEEDDEEDEGRNGEGKDSGSEEGTSFASRFNKKWGWISCVDTVAHTMGVSWDVIFEKNVVEFLNVLCYTRDKAELEKQQMKEFKNKLNKTKVF